MIGFKANSHLPLPALLSKCINSEIKMKNVFLNFLSRAGSIQVASMEKLFQISNINFKKSLNPYRILYECHSLWILELKTLLLPFFDGMKYSTKLGEQIRHMSTGCQSDLSGEPHFQISHLSSFTFHIFHDLSHVPASVRLIFFFRIFSQLDPESKNKFKTEENFVETASNLQSLVKCSNFNIQGF